MSDRGEPPGLSVFGVRHHGPGSARALAAALDRYDPDAVLVEGPPDADELIPLIADADARPPLALMVYAPQDPALAVWYPFHHYSPEWVALRWALAHGALARFCDLPQRHRLGQPSDADRGDGLAALAAAAGYDDADTFWEDCFESRETDEGLFDAVFVAMSALREHDLIPASPREAQREAWMRRVVRETQKEGAKRIAIVCGAWHAPAIVSDAARRDDDQRLKGLPKVKVECTWVPWSEGKLALQSGYGAGVKAPGWYKHLFEHSEDRDIRWVGRAAELWRTKGQDVSPGHSVEAVRLARALAALRGRPAPGLTELQEALQATVCGGREAPMAQLRRALEVGEAIGVAPAGAPMMPIQRDLEQQVTRLRLRPLREAEHPPDLTLDLRDELGRARSALLRRLNLLGAPWGETRDQTGRERGSFAEVWRLRWRLDMPLRLIEAAPFGNTVAAAAGAKAIARCQANLELPALTELLDEVLLADLPEAVDPLLTALSSRAALSTDLSHLLRCLGPLAQITRYGDVRATPAERVRPVLLALFERAVVGLPAACRGIDDLAAERLCESVEAAHLAILTLDDAGMLSEWAAALRRLCEDDEAHGRLRGRATRLMLEGGRLDGAELSRLARLNLTTARSLGDAAGWLEGVLAGSGLLLIHQDGLWAALDQWLSDLQDVDFRSLLPVARRAFAHFSHAERRAMGDKVRALGLAPAPEARLGPPIHEARARLVLPALATMLGASRLGDRS